MYSPLSAYNVRSLSYTGDEKDTVEGAVTTPYPESGLYIMYSILATSNMTIALIITICGDGTCDLEAQIRIRY